MPSGGIVGEVIYIYNKPGYLHTINLSVQCRTAVGVFVTEKVPEVEIPCMVPKEEWVTGRYAHPKSTTHIHGVPLCVSGAQPSSQEHTVTYITMRNLRRVSASHSRWRGPMALSRSELLSSRRIKVVATPPAYSVVDLFNHKSGDSHTNPGCENILFFHTNLPGASR